MSRQQTVHATHDGGDELAAHCCDYLQTRSLLQLRCEVAKVGVCGRLCSTPRTVVRVVATGHADFATGVLTAKEIVIVVAENVTHNNVLQLISNCALRLQYSLNGKVRMMAHTSCLKVVAQQQLRSLLTIEVTTRHCLDN